MAKEGARVVRLPEDDALSDLQAYSGSHTSIVRKLIEKDGIDALDNVKAILESMPC